MTDRLPTATARVKIFGERSTGTKFIRETLRINGLTDLWPGTLVELGEQARLAWLDHSPLPEADRALLREGVIDDVLTDSFERSLGWKHGAPDIGRLARLEGETRFVVTVKNPYAWVVSMYRHPYHNLLSGNLGSIAAFVGSPWLTCGRDNAPRVFDSIVDLWNFKYRRYLALSAIGEAIVVPYETILTSPRGLSDLAARLGHDGANWRLPDRLGKATDDRTFFQDYYANERWRADLDEAAMTLVTDKLDHGLVAALGYHPGA